LLKIKMKIPIHSTPMLVLSTILSAGISPFLLAQNSQPAPSSDSALVHLSPDVADVLKLAHSQVGDATIIAFIRNSGKVYSMGASDLIYLRDQGVSDQVLTVMLNQQNNAPATATQAAPPVAVPSNSTQYVAVGAQPAASYTDAAPVYAQPSTAYVYPTTYSYPYYYPYYGSYWGYPSVYFGFGYWGGHYGSCYGGYHGGHYGGGYHGGGGGHGGHH
jgi:hypothetical protein